LSAATPVAVPLTERIHEPTLIGEVALSIRNVFRNRDGTPRSETSNGGLADTPASARAHARRASTSLPVSVSAPRAATSRLCARTVA
jgi:hypothetical protein